MGNGSSDSQDAPILASVCDERSKRIEEKVDSGMAALKSALERMDLRLETIVNEHTHILQDHHSSIDRIAQSMADHEKAKEKSHRGAMLWVAIVAVAVSLLSNLDKIIAALK